MKTAIVLLPGLDGTGRLFQPFLPSISDFFRPMVVRYPGREKLDYPALLERILTSLPSDEKFIVLGESFSGPLAVMVANAKPIGLEAIVLCATFVRNPRRIPSWLLHPLVQPFLFKFYPQFTAIKALLGGYSTPELRKRFSEAMSEVNAEVIAYRVRQVLKVDVSRQLACCSVPVLYLQGQRDMVVPRHNAKAIKKIFPQTTVAPLPAPHMVLQANPECAAKEIYHFYKTITGAKNI